MHCLLLSLALSGCLPRKVTDDSAPTDTGIDTEGGAGTDTDTDTDTDSAEPCTNGTYAVTASGLTLYFARVCAATFDMGCTPGQRPTCTSDGAEETEHSVTLTHDTLVGSTEITQDQFQAVMGYNPSTFTGGSMPVETLGWHQSAAFAVALSHAEGLQECYACSGSGTTVTCAVTVNPNDCGGFRLLTDAEWEAAGRCGSDETYAGSDDANSVAWYASNDGSSPKPVGTLAPNGCGLYDMSGNLWEWTQDWYDAVSSSPATDPTGASSGSARVIRGGYWGSDAAGIRVGNRSYYVPETADAYIGIRLRGPAI